LALYGSDAELAAAFAVNFAAWGDNCGRISTSLKTHYGLESDAVAFFDPFANLPPADATALEVVLRGPDRGVTLAVIERAAPLLQAYELMCLLALVVFAGCASTKVTQQTPMNSPGLAWPNRIWVYNFVANPADLRADSSLRG
jgi:hypothetical protein